MERYNVDFENMREGIGELMKHRVNNVLDHSGPFTLVLAADNYFATLTLAENCGVDCSEYKRKIMQFEEEMSK